MIKGTSVKNLSAVSGILVLIFGLNNTAQAQLEEVVVTAQKRPQDVQDVPISITALSGDFLTETGVNTLQDISAYVPNLSLTKSSQVANNRIIMRGVGSVGNNAIEPSVAVFIDGVYYPRPSSVVGSLADLEMVEVLRGPQGTFFGRNASMGALNIRTAKPTQDFEADLRASYGDYSAVRVFGNVSGGLTENTAGRLSIQYSDHDGYGDNTFPRPSTDAGAWQDMSLRGQLNFNPTDTLEINLTADYATVDNNSSVIEVISDSMRSTYLPTISAILSPTGPFTPTGQVPETTNGFDHVIHQDHRDNADDDQWGIAATVNWSFGEHTIRSITSFRDWSNDTFESALRLPADLLNRETAYEVDTVSQEFQILSPTGGKIEYVAGFYYYNEDYSIDQNFDLGSEFCSPAVGNYATILTARNGTAASVAIAQVAAGLQALGIPAPLSTAIATGLISGTITTSTDLTNLGLPDMPAGTHAAILAAASPATVATAATAIGGQAAAFCNAYPSDNAIDTQFNQDMTSIALYGQLTYNVTDKLRLTAGLRWTSDDKSGQFTSVINNPIAAPPTLANPFGLDLRINENSPLSFEDDEITWLINASYYITDNIMGYGTYSTGYKSGGFNSEGFNSLGTAGNIPRVYASESVDNYEFGLKTTLFDNRLIANLTYFNTEISNFQDRQFDGVNFIVQNAGVLTQSGLELDVQAQPSDYLYAVIGISYLDSEFDSFPNATNLPAVVAQTQNINRTRAGLGLPPIAVPPRNMTGARNHFSPAFQYSMMAEWSGNLPVYNDLGWFFRLGHTFVTKQNLGAETNANPQSMQTDYHIVNTRIGIRKPDGKWEMLFYLNNVFNQDYCQTIFNQPLGTTLQLVALDASNNPVDDAGGMQRCVLGTPRNWGFEAAYKF